MRDIIIAGAGPVGTYTASLLEKKAEVLILEKGRIGGKACSGLVSKRLEDFVPIKREWLEHKVKGAVVHSPSGKALEIRKPGTLAYVIDRPKFDKWMAGRVKSEVRTGAPVKSIRVGKDVRVNGISASLLIGCDGAQSGVRKHFGVGPKEMLTGLVAMVEESDRSDMVEVWIDKKIVKDGFLWKIPRGERTEYGMLGGRAGFRQLERFFKIKKYHKSAGLIPLGLVKTYFNRAILVGDAACQVKPWSGGGLVYGFAAAQVAAKTILKCLKEGGFSESCMRGYEKGWRRLLEGSIKKGMIMRSIYKRMGNRSIELLFNRHIENRLSKRDMDFPLLDQFKL